MKENVSTVVPATTPVAEVLDGCCKTAADCCSGKQPDVEALAQSLHEAGREAVVKGNTVAVGHRTFIEWVDTEEHVKEGRRIQARWLLAHYNICVR